MRVVCGARMPGVARQHYRRLADGFLDRHDLALGAIDHHLSHPGSAKVLPGFEQAGDLPPCALDHSRAILRRWGNMPSAMVLFVLERFLAAGIAPGDHGLLTVFGTGFSPEMVLLAG